MDKRCDIILPVWNERRLTEACIDSIVRNTDYPYRLIVIDNASDRETADYLRSVKGRGDLNVLVVRNEVNLGFVKAVNQGLRLADAPYVCVMNNDTRATRGWLEEMIGVMEAHPAIGMVNPSSNTFGQSPGSETIDEYAARLASFRGEVQELSTCRGFCMLVKRDVVEKAGLFDEVFEYGYFDETDYCKRAQALGFASARAKAAYVYHEEGASFARVNERENLFKKNEAVFFARWGRPVRVAYFVDKPGFDDRVDDIVTHVARKGHQVLVFLKKGSRWPVRLDHYDIRRFDLNPVFFGIAALFSIVKRKRKKKVDLLLTDNRLLGALLKATKALHGSCVVVNPVKDTVLELVRERSKHF